MCIDNIQNAFKSFFKAKIYSIFDLLNKRKKDAEFAFFLFMV